MQRNLQSFVTALMLGACAAPAAKPEVEEEALLDGAADSFAHPIDHGDIPFGAPRYADLEETARFHAWQFTLTGDAAIGLETHGESADSREVDTVLYLYREGPRGWGRYIARNDDAHPGTLFSAISRDLGAGRYRAIVRGYTRYTDGPFGLTVSCAGGGCGAPPEPRCLFGETFNDLRSSPDLPHAETFLTSPAGLGELEREQIVIAVQQSSHTDVQTAEEAFARVDQGEIRRLEIVDPLGARRFVAFEYGAGDNSYGAVFFDRTTTLASRIHDGDLLECAAIPERCAFGNHFGDLLGNPEFAPVLDGPVMLPQARSNPLLGAQIVAAFQVAAPDETELERVFARADEGRVRRLDLAFLRRGLSFTVIEFVLGDHRFGAVFDAGTTDAAAEIFDSEMRACATFALGSVGDACVPAAGGTDCVTGDCVATPEGPWCDRIYCTAPCTTDRDCKAFARAAGAANVVETRCEPSAGHCWFERSGLGAQVCE